MDYEFLLLDADNTLLDFDMNERVSLMETFRHFKMPCGDEELKLYHEINLMYWNMLAENKIDRQALLIKRFETFFERLGITADPEETENFYRAHLGLGCQLMPGAVEVCNKLRKNHRLYIITNGVSSTQHSRLEGSGLASLMDGIFISEEIGYNKPSVKFFEYVKEHIEGFDSQKALVVGDSLSSDIRGGIDFGLDTCWINVYKSDNTSEIKPKYEIQDIAELPKLLSGILH